jgi:hypothetical protein
MHDMAMEFYDQAKLSKIKGQEEEYNQLLQKAYLVEREAALKMPAEESDNYWQYMLIRSAAHLAHQCGEYKQALQLVYWGLAGHPPVYEKTHLENLLKELTANSSKEVTSASQKILYGILSAADLDSGQITIRSIENEQLRVINISKTMIQKTARYLIGEVIRVEGKVSDNGGVIVERIRLMD